MYITQRDGKSAVGVSVPENYGGSAFSPIGYRDDALREAEAAFGRGYVFEEMDDVAEPTVHTDSPIAPQNVREDVLSRLFSVENIILVSLIFILWDSGADDELLLMLVILLFC